MAAPAFTATSARSAPDPPPDITARATAALCEGSAAPTASGGYDDTPSPSGVIEKLRISPSLASVYKTLGSQFGTRDVKREITSGFVWAGLGLLLGGSFLALRSRGRLP